MSAPFFVHPILTCAEARIFESSLLTSRENEWRAMRRAGEGIAKAVLLDYAELRPVPDKLRILALVGKGHNGGDALIACHELLAQYPRASVCLLMSSGREELRPLAKQALDQLEDRVSICQIAPDASLKELSDILNELSGGEVFNLCLDGLLGMSISGALRAPLKNLIEAINEFDGIEVRASVDLPSGVSDGEADLCFSADFSYSTGIAKKALFRANVPCGRVRYIDLGFFEGLSAGLPEPEAYVITPRALEPLRRLRPAAVDKRTFGHLYIVGGSKSMPGALLMAVKAAVRSGVGRVTAFAPVSVAATLSAQVPEAMWVAWPETANGTLNPRAMPLLLDRLVDRATAVLCGPGMGQDRNTEMVAQDIVRHVEQPVVLDADALRPKIIELANKRKPEFGPVVVTPHMGEYMRIAKSAEPDPSCKALREFCKLYRLTTVLKGPLTRVCDGEQIYYNTYGGPVLSRGGSGDILAGIVAGMLAHDTVPVMEKISRGLLLHGMAAQRLARKSGQIAVNTTQILDYLPEVLRLPED